MNLKIQITLLFSLFLFIKVEAQSTYFVAGNGSNSASGTITQPWETISFGVTMLQPGDTLFVRQGIYDGYFDILNSGQPDNQIFISNYLDEQVIIDGSSIPVDPNNSNLPNLVTITGENIIFDGFELQFAALRTIVTGGDYITLNSLIVRNGYGSGITAYQCSFNTITNCIVHDLYDYDDPNTGGGGGNTDGIKISAGNTMPYPDYGHTIIKNNIVYNISDDGIDTWSSRGNTIEANRVYNSGYTNEGNGFLGTLKQPAGDGNGYKLGGAGQSGQNQVINNISYQNRFAGFDGNSGIKNVLFQNTTFNEPIGFRALRSDYTLKNNLAHNNSSEIFTFADSYPSNSIANSWELGITDPQFESEDPNLSTFLNLSITSPAIDVGSDLLLDGVLSDYNGTDRPQGLGFDIGAFEFQPPLSVKELTMPSDFVLFPNPATDFVFINQLENNIEKTEVKIYNYLGKLISTRIISSSTKIDISQLQSGLYLLIVNDNESVFKLIKK